VRRGGCAYDKNNLHERAAVRITRGARPEGIGASVSFQQFAGGSGAEKMKLAAMFLDWLRQFAVQLKVQAREETSCPNLKQHESRG